MSALDLLRRLHEEATPGPWEEKCGEVIAHDADTDGMMIHGYVAETPYSESADARLIATVRTLLPELIWLAESVGRASKRGYVPVEIRGAMADLDARAAELAGSDR